MILICSDIRLIRHFPVFPTVELEADHFDKVADQQLER